MKDRKIRRLLLVVLCLFTFTYSATLMVLLLAGLCYAGWISDAIGEYVTSNSVSRLSATLILAAGTLLHGQILTGAAMIWKHNRKGYMVLSSACLILVAYSLFQRGIGLLFPALYIILIVLFGFYCRKPAQKNPESGQNTEL